MEFVAHVNKSLPETKDSINIRTSMHAIMAIMTCVFYS